MPAACVSSGLLAASCVLANNPLCSNALCLSLSRVCLCVCVCVCGLWQLAEHLATHKTVNGVKMVKIDLGELEEPEEAAPFPVEA